MLIKSSWTVRIKNITARIWFNPEQKENILSKKPVRFIIMCYGWPSHPYDHNPALNQKLLQNNFVLVYPDYIGTWASKGEFNVDNSVSTILQTINFLKKGSSYEMRHNSRISWKAKDITLIGGSFGGSVALVAGAKSKEVNKIIAASPVTDWRTHNNLKWEEEDLSQTFNFIQRAYNNLWRMKEKDFKRLEKGSVDLNPADYIEILKNKNVFLIHSRDDASVSYHRSEELYKELIKGKGDHKLFLTNNDKHVTQQFFDLPKYYNEIKSWL